MRGLSETDVRALLKKYNIRPSKKMGQSFLTNQSVVRRIVDYADIESGDTILEIGGGFGILSKALAKKAGHLTIIEIDKRLVQALKDSLSTYDNVTIIQDDALKISLPDVDKVVSNLPYSISSEITFRILQEIAFERAVLMYQKEFAKRLVAEPCTSQYSRLTIDISYLAHIKELFDIEASSFHPTPLVDSTVVELKQRQDGIFTKNSDVFFWMVRGMYSYPNKQLRKALRIWFKRIGCMKEAVDRLLDDLKEHVSGEERLRCLKQDTLIRLADCVLLLVDEGVLPDPRDPE